MDRLSWFWRGVMVWYLSCATCVLADQRTMSFNEEVNVVPAPGEMVIDGKDADWDLSAGIWSYNSPVIVDRFSVWTHLMWDEKGVYFLARFHDQTPMVNRVMGKDFSHSWRADCFQARVIFDDRTPAEHQMHINLFYSTLEQKPYMIVHHGGHKDDDTGPPRADLAERFGNDMASRGGKVAIAPWADGKGYNIEAFWPWSYCRLEGSTMRPGESFVFGIEGMWGNPRGEPEWPMHRLADNVNKENANRIFMFRARKDWGRAVIRDKGHLDITERQKELQAVRLRQFQDYDTYGSLPITYSLPDDREVTIAIDDANGVRVRNLFGQYPRKAGQATDYWDGLDDAGKPVAPGTYGVTIVDHRPIGMKFVNSVYNAATPPWPTDEGTKLWGSNHGHPTAIATRGNITLVGFTGTEGGAGLIRINSDTGIIQWADGNEILDVAIGEKYAFTLSRDMWIKKTVVRRLSLENAQLVPFGDAARSPNIALVPNAAESDRVPNASSIAHAHGRLYVQMRGYSLKVLDPETGDVQLEVPADDLRAIRDRDGKLYGLFADGMVAVINADGKKGETVFVAQGLAQPVRLGVSHDAARFAISDQKTNQVFVYSADGERIQTVGEAYEAKDPPNTEKLGGAFGVSAAVNPNGERPAGTFVQTDLILPLGVDFDSKGRLWIAEASKTSKRITTWSADAKLLKQYWGGADYGAMAGFPFTNDHTRFIAHGVEFKFDPNPDPWTRPTAETPLMFHPDIAPARGFVYVYEGREYAVTAPGYQGGYGFFRDLVIAMRDDAGIFRPRVRVKFGDRGAPNSAWIDRNYNGIADPGETVDNIKGQKHYWSVGWVGPDLTILTGDQWIYPLKGLTEQGVPLYDFANAVRPPNTIEIDLHAQGSTGTAVIDRAGNISNGIAFHTVDGRRGSYPNPYGRHDGPAARRGLLTAPFRTNGVVEDVPGVGSITALAGDRGEWFLMSMDGLFISSICQDAKGEVTLDETYTGQESFGGFIWKDERGKIMVQLGGASYRIMELTGLETTRRQQLSVTITSEQIGEGSRIAAARHKDAMSEPSELLIARVEKLPAEPVAAEMPQGTPLIASAPDWKVVEAGNPARWWRAAMAHDGRNLAVMYQVADPSPWKNGAGSFTHAFIGGDAVDLQLDIPGRGPIRVLAAPVEGRNTVIYWQKETPEKVNPMTYVVENNPANARAFDVVKRLESATVKSASGFSGYSILLTIPLADLGIDPANLESIKGIVGVIYSDPTGTNRAVRLYWHDKNTGMVSDVPTESALNVANWGPIRIGR